MIGQYILKELSRYQLGTFADVIYRNALLYPDMEAFVWGPDRVSFRNFNERVNRLVHGLRAKGIRKGDVIGVLSWNRLEYQEAFGAAMKGGYILAHFSPRLNTEELVGVINDSEAKVVLLESEFAETLFEARDRLTHVRRFVVLGKAPHDLDAYDDIVKSQPADEPDVQVGENDPLTIFYTSGTTGVPRGGLYTHAQKLENAVVKSLDIGLQFGDRHLVVLPMFHIGGDSHIWPFFLNGGCNVISPKRNFDPVEMLQTIRAERITDVHIVPTQLVALLGLPDLEQWDLPTLKRIWYAASPMPVEVLKRGLAVFGPVFLQGYGQTESGPHTTVLRNRDHRQFMESPEDSNILASCGQPCLGVHMRIVDEEGRDVQPGTIGEILIRSKRVMSGYWRREEETSRTIKDGWLGTGDMGYYDDKGYVYIADRKKDMIITGGENVFPKEVEEILYRHPSVEEAAVIGIPDSYWIEKVHAVIALKKGAPADADDVIAFCREHLARYKAPKSVEFVDVLPKSPQGKILKKEIRAKYWKESE